MNYTSSVQNTSQSVYTPYIIKPSNNNDYVTYADLIKLGNVTDFGYKDGYTSFNTWQEFIKSVHEHLIDLYERLGGIIPDTVSVTGVTITPPKTQTIYIDSTHQFRATVSPSNANNYSINWTSAAPTIATVNSSGLVTGKTAGQANIKVTIVDNNSNNTYTDSATIIVQQRNPDPANVPVTGVSISPTSAILTSIGATKQLNATVSPSNATNTTVTWSSSNQAIATVSTNGLVTAKAAGTVNITVETESGGHTATCAITVSPTSQTTYYWYVGRESDGIPTSFSNVQTDKTAPGWHEIGTTLNGYNYNFDDTDKTVVLSTTTQTYKYYIIIPTGLHMTDIFNTNYELESVGEFVPVNCSITGYKAFKSTNAVRKVWGLILKQ